MTVVLHVEDNPQMRELVRDYLEMAGYTVLSAESGQEGIALAPRCDLLILDLNLSAPGPSGVEVFEAIRAQVTPTHPMPPVIILTGMDKTLSRTWAKLVGVKTVLLKPVDMRLLHAAVAGVLPP